MEPLVWGLCSGAMLAAVMFFLVRRKESALEQVTLAWGKQLGKWFYSLSKYLFCGVTLVVLIPGAVFGGSWMR